MSGRKPTDLTGKVFGRLLPLERVGTNSDNRAVWLCQCVCGNVKEAASNLLTRGATISCGCLKKELADNAVRSNRLYTVHHDMMRRCYDTRVDAYPHYGGRGITVDVRWHDVRVFIADVESWLLPGLTLERSNNDGPYSPDNCEAATRKQQARNRRNTVKLEFEGGTKPLAEWAELKGLSYRLVADRLRKGWSIEKALTEPKHENN